MILSWKCQGITRLGKQSKNVKNKTSIDPFIQPIHLLIHPFLFDMFKWHNQSFHVWIYPNHGIITHIWYACTGRCKKSWHFSKPLSLISTAAIWHSKVLANSNQCFATHFGKLCDLGDCSGRTANTNREDSPKLCRMMMLFITECKWKW